jgi:hypothetical protein
MSYRPATLSDQIGGGAVDIDGDGDHIRQLFGALSLRIVRDCRIAPAIGRRQKISDSSAKGEQFGESTRCGRG